MECHASRSMRVSIYRTRAPGQAASASCRVKYRACRISPALVVCDVATISTQRSCSTGRSHRASRRVIGVTPTRHWSCGLCPREGARGELFIVPLDLLRKVTEDESFHAGAF